MSKTWFITGTDTEVGKTSASCAVLEAAQRRGLRTAAVKPVAAGCDDTGCNEDALQLLEHMTEALDYRQVNPVVLREAIAPHIAARHQGVRVQISRLAGFCRGVMSCGADLVLIEGAGGWRVPIGPRETMADLARELSVEVVLVVGMRLGCINHALLTAEAVHRDGLKLAGWIANAGNSRMACHEENLDTLRGLLGAPMLGEIPRIVPFSAGQASKHIDLEALYGK